MSVAQDFNQNGFPFAIIDGIFTDLYSVLIDQSTPDGSFDVVEIEIVARDKKRLLEIKDVFTLPYYQDRLNIPIFMFTGNIVLSGRITYTQELEIENIANSGPGILSVSFQTDIIVSADSITEAREAIA